MIWLILALAAALRLILFNQSLWLDESIEALALMGKMGPILHYALYDFQPPLYHLILFGWTRLVGFSEIALRLPSFFSGLGLVWFTFKLGELLGGKRVGVVAGLLAATNPLLVYYSQEGRTYEMTAFFVTAGFYYLFLNLKKSTAHSAWLYFIFTALSLWTSYIAWIVIGLQGLYLMTQKKFTLFKLTLISALTLLLWLPSLLQSLGIGLSTAGHSPEWSKIVGGVSVKALALTWVKMNLGRISFDNKIIYGLVVVIVLVLHSLVLRRLKKPNFLLFIWLLGSIIFASIISFLVPVYSYTRVLFIVPAYLLLLALAGAKNKILVSLLIIVQLFTLFYFWLTPRFHKEDWRSLTAYLNSQTGAVAMPSLNQSAPLTYYGLKLPLFEPKLGVLNQVHNVYYLKYVEDLFDVDRVGPTKLQTSGYEVVQEKSFVGLQLVMYEKTSY